MSVYKNMHLYLHVCVHNTQKYLNHKILFNVTIPYIVKKLQKDSYSKKKTKLFRSLINADSSLKLLLLIFYALYQRPEMEVVPFKINLNYGLPDTQIWKYAQPLSMCFGL